MIRRMTILHAFLLALSLAAPASSQVPPPDAFNYQGVLRDGDGQPRDGSFDMTFRFFDAASGGNEILVDEHLATGSGGVTVANGLFSIALGGGVVSDGAAALPGDPFTTLNQALAAFSDIWMQIEIGAAAPEVLSPRVKVLSAPFALNAGSLNGMTNANFIDTSAATQIKEGDLEVGSLTVNTGLVDFQNGAQIEDVASGIRIVAGNSEVDDVRLTAGRGSFGEGAINIFGQGQIEFFAGNGEYIFRGNAAAQVARINANGNLSIGLGSSGDNDFIGFDGDLEQLFWDDSQTRFEFTDSLAFSGVLSAGSSSSSLVPYHQFGVTPSANPDISSLNDVNVSSDLEVGDDLYVKDTIVVGDGTPATFGYSSFGSGTSSIPEVSSSNDVYVTGDVEIDGFLYANTTSGFVVRHLSGSNLVNMIDNNNSTSGDEARWYHDGQEIGAEQLAELQENGNFRIRSTLSQFASFDVAESFLALEKLSPGELVAVDPSRPDAVRRSRGVDDAVIGVVSTRAGVLLGGAPFDAESLRDIWGGDVLQRFDGQRAGLRQQILADSPEVREELQRLAARAGDPEDTAWIDDSGRQTTRAQRLKELESEIEGRSLEVFCEDALVPVALIGRVPVQVDSGFGAIRRGDTLAPSPIDGVAMRARPGDATLGVALEDFDRGRGTVMTLIDRGSGQRDASRIAGPDGEAAAAARSTDFADRERQATGGADLQAAISSALAQRRPVSTSRIELPRDDDGVADLEIRVPGTTVAAAAFRVDADGNVFAGGALQSTASEVAELFPAVGRIEAGDVVVVTDGGALTRSDRETDTGVVGVAAATPGLRLGADLLRYAEGHERLAYRLSNLDALEPGARAAFWADVARRFEADHVAVAVAGTVTVKVDAGYGAIRPGDLLTSSPTAGHAMASADAQPGTVLGKALGSLDSGTGRLRMLVMPR